MKKANNNRALMTSFLIHGLILLLAVFPLVSMVRTDSMEDMKASHIIEIAFENGDMSPSSSSTQPGEKKIEVPEKEPLVKKEEPVVKTPEQSTILKNKKLSTIERAEVEMDEGVQQEDIPIAETEQDQVLTNEETKVGETGEGSDTAGEGEVGEEITGRALANMDFEGEGVFGRQIVYHANISRLAEKEGRVVVNLCINRSGDVTHVAFNRDASTLTESSYVREVMRVASKYKFEKDYEAPKIQCGKLTFIFEFN